MDDKDIKIHKLNGMLVRYQQKLADADLSIIQADYDLEVAAQRIASLEKQLQETVEAE